MGKVYALCYSSLTKEQEASEAEAKAKAEQEASEAEAKIKTDSKAAKKEKHYKIVCCNSINDTIGGVAFKDGIAFTENAYAASWFANKTGYVVSKE